MRVKRKLSVLFAAAIGLLLTALLLPVCTRQAKAAEAVTDICVEESSITLQLGGEPVQLTVKVTPATATEGGGVTWLAENPNIVAVDYNNKAHALSVGTTTLHMISDQGNFRDSLTVTVEATEAVLEGITLDKNEYTGQVGDQFYLVPSITPDGFAVNVVWRSSDTRIAIVNNGTVMLVGEGTCTVSIRDEDGLFNDACNITVTAAEKGNDGSDGGCKSSIGSGMAAGCAAVFAAVALGLTVGSKTRRKKS